MTDPIKIESRNGGLPRDIDFKAIQVASGIRLHDASTPFRVSPLTVEATVLEIVIPENAVVLVLTPDVADMRYGKTSTLDGTVDGKLVFGYQILRDGDSIAVPVANRKSIHVVQDSAQVTLYFHFEMLVE